MNITPKISIIMPAYNAEAYLPATLDSILAQTYGSFELTVVDDGSSDSTLSILEEYSGRDSRNSIVGCIAEEQIIGRAVFRLWPMNQFGVIKKISEIRGEQQ